METPRTSLLPGKHGGNKVGRIVKVVAVTGLALLALGLLARILMPRFMISLPVSLQMNPQTGCWMVASGDLGILPSGKALVTARNAEALKRGWGRVPEWIFCNENAGPLDGDNLRHRVFYKVLAKAGLRRVRFHDLRHTFASLLIAQGESLAYVRDQSTSGRTARDTSLGAAS
jgi:integrase-like protein